MARIIKRNRNFFVFEDKISTTQALGYGRTKKDAIDDFNDSLNNIFSDKREREIHRIKRRR